MPPANQAIAVLREVMAGLVRREGPLLTSHQLAVYLTCYVLDGDHTVRGLAKELNVSKSIITRALDRLGELDLARRQLDPADRRSVIVKRTARGAELLAELRSYAQAVIDQSQAAPPSAAPSADIEGTPSGSR